MGALEAMSSKQERDIEELNRQRTRASKLDQDLADMGPNAVDDDDEDEPSIAAPVVKKSELRDGRIEAALAKPSASGTSQQAVTKTSSVAAFKRVTNVMKLQRALGGSRLSMGDPAAGAANPLSGSSRFPGHGTMINEGNVGTVPGWQSNQQIQHLQEKISEKEVKIAKTKELHDRMKKEFATLRYCAKKAEEGLESILESFTPEQANYESESSLGSKSGDEDAVSKQTTDEKKLDASNKNTRRKKN